MSDLIDRYLAAIAANLPKAERDDIAAELRDVLYSKKEAKEEQLGRPLTKAEEEALLKEFGHPLEVASRYQKNQQLIGPSTYPFYIFALKVTLGIVVIIYIALLAVSLIAGGHDGPHTDFVGTLITAFAIVTIVFVVIERIGGAAKLAANWKPAQLPMMGAPKSRSMWDILFEMVAAVIATLWWVGLFKIPDPTPHNIDIKLATVFHTLYWPILLLLLAQLVMDGFELIMPGLARLHAWLRIAYHVVLLAIFWVMWQAGHWIDVTVLSGRPDLTEKLQYGFDRGFKIGIGFGVLCVLYEIGRAGLRLVRYGRMTRLARA